MRMALGFEMCEQFHGDFWNMTGDAWSRMDITLYPDQEPELSFTMEDWCDVNEELKRALLKRKAFGVVEENDRALLSAYDAYLACHMGKDGFGIIFVRSGFPVRRIRLLLLQRNFYIPVKEMGNA